MLPGTKRLLKPSLGVIGCLAVGVGLAGAFDAWAWVIVGLALTLATFGGLVMLDARERGWPLRRELSALWRDMQAGEVSSGPRLIDAAASFVAPLGDRVDAAFVMTRGMRPGAEALGLLGVIVLPAAPSLVSAALAGAVFGALFCVLVAATRVPYLVAVTDDSLHLIRCRRLRKASPVRIETTVSRDALHFVDAGDARVELQGVRYWVVGTAADNARQIARQNDHPDS